MKRAQAGFPGAPKVHLYTIAPGPAHCIKIAVFFQFFLYHSMVVTVGLYMGFGPDSDVSLRSFKGTMALLQALDMPTFYLNSVFSQPVYVAGKPAGIVYRTNFFSSYVNPLGLALPERWQWLAYLALRLGLAAGLIALLLLLASGRGRLRGGRALNRPHNTTTQRSIP